LSGSEPKLIEPTRQLQAAYLRFVDEFAAAGEQLHQEDHGLIERTGGFEGYVRMLRRHSRGLDLPADMVPYDTYWLVRDGTVPGTIRLRHRLNADLENEGGHIGYDVRPTERGKGYATLTLARVLDEARRMGLQRVLLTCDKSNVASQRVIRKLTGRRQDDRTFKGTDKRISRYWIDLQHDAPSG